MDYYYYTGISKTQTEDGNDIKSQFGDKTCSEDLEPDSTGLKAEDKSGTCKTGVSLATTKSKLATDKKNFTACT